MENLTLSETKMKYNNEVTQIKDYIQQAKTQTINNLARKAKVLKNRKGDTDQLEKNKRKTDSIVSEIMLLKQITRNELAKFAMHNFENCNKYINSPVASKERAMARLLLHKSLTSRFSALKEKYSSIPTEKLLEQDPKKVRRKARKEKLKSLQKNKPKEDKNKEKGNEKSTISKLKNDSDLDIEENIEESPNSDDEGNSEGDSDVETKPRRKIEIASPSESEESMSDTENECDVISKPKTTDDFFQRYSDNEHSSNSDNDTETSILSNNIKKAHSKKLANSSTSDFQVEDVPVSNINSSKLKPKSYANDDPEEITNNKSVKPSKKFKPPTKFAVDVDEDTANVTSEKIVDSFFKTDAGNYMSLMIPRPPDSKSEEVSDYPNTANRRMRRAAMFGNEFKSKKQHNRDRDVRNYQSNNGRNDNFSQNNAKNQHGRDNFKRANDSYEEKLHPSWEAKKQKSSLVAFQGKKTDLSGSNDYYHNKNDSKKGKSFNNDFTTRNQDNSANQEKLHPSWEAKKQKSILVPFQGNKIVFDD